MVRVKAYLQMRILKKVSISSSTWDKLNTATTEASTTWNILTLIC